MGFKKPFFQEQFPSFFNKVDKGLIFPLFLVMTTPFTYFICGIVLTYFYVLTVSLAHACLLLYFPYIKDSDYYRYIVLKEKFYKENIRYQHFFSHKIVVLSKVVVFFSFYLLFNFTGVYVAIFPLHCLATVVFMSSISVDILNIVYRPRLPEKIQRYNLLLQNRYSPVTEIVLNKVVPLCANIAGYTASGYLAFAGGFKALNGLSEIDPLRNGFLNHYYRFPSTHKWNEISLSAWSTFRDQTAHSPLSYDAKVNAFLKREEQFVEKVRKAVTDLCDNKTD